MLSVRKLQNTSLINNAFNMLKALVTRPLSTSNANIEIKAEKNKEQTEERELDDLFKNVVVDIKGHEWAVLRSYITFVSLVAKELELGLEVSTIPRVIERWTLLKAKFSKRKHMRQYEIRTHQNRLVFTNLTGSTCDTLLEYIQRNLPEGVAMEVHKTKLMSLPENFNQKKEEKKTTTKKS